MSKKAKTVNTRLSRDLLYKIWDAIPIQQWNDLLYANQKDKQFRVRGPDELLGKCLHPAHADQNPSFYIYPQRRFARCYGCDSQITNPIYLAALILETNESDALTKLQEKFGLSFLPSKLATELEERRLWQETKHAVFNTVHTMMCEALAVPGSSPWADGAISWLVNDRQIPIETLPDLPVGVLPPMMALLERMQDSYEKSFALWDSNHRIGPTPNNYSGIAQELLQEHYKSSLFTGSVVWPLHVTPSEIGQLKLRVPHNNNPKDIQITSDKFESDVGLFGLGWSYYKEHLKPDQPGWIYVTEGEMDVMSCMARFVQNRNFPMYLVSAGGTGASKYVENILLSSGLKGIYYVGDAPDKGVNGGDDVVQQWLEKTSRLPVRIYNNWPALQTSAQVNDLDSAAVIRGVAPVIEELVTHANDTCIPAWKWAAEHVMLAFESLDAKDTRAYIEAAAAHGGYLKNALDLERFVAEIYQHYPEQLISKELIKREIQTRDDDETGFILRCMDALKDHYTVVTTKNDSSGRMLSLYDKSRKIYRRIKMDSETSIAQELAPTFGSVLDFVDNHVGFPKFMQHPRNSEEPSIIRVDRMLRYYLKEAVNKLAPAALENTQIIRLNQGYFYRESPLHGLREYISCGNQVFRITREGGDTQYTLLDGPVDGQFVFNLHHDLSGSNETPWLPLSLNLLNKYKNVDHVTLYSQLYRYFDSGFRFRNHVVTCKLLAAVFMAIPIMDCVGPQMRIHLAGESSSGKSTLLDAAAGLAKKDIRLLYCSHGSTRCTLAALTRETDESSLLYAIDEFEAKDSQQQNTVEAITELLRGLSSGHAYRTTADKNGETSRKTHHRMTTMTAAIACVDREQDLNRLLMIDTLKVDGKDSPDVVLIKEFGSAEAIKELGYQLTLGMYPKVPEFLANYEYLMSHFDDIKAATGMEALAKRFTTALTPALAVMRMLGQDWQGFLKEYVQVRSSNIIRSTLHSESDELMHVLMQNPIIMNPETKALYSVAKILLNPNTRADLNESACGIYFDDQHNLLVILLEQAATRLAAPRGKQLSTSRFREILSRHREALTPHEVENSGVLGRLRQHTGAGLSERDVVVIRAGRWLDSSNGTLVTATAPTTKNGHGKETPQEAADAANDENSQIFWPTV